MNNPQPISTAREFQKLVAQEVACGNIRPDYAHAMLFPEDKVTAENMAIRELYDNQHLYKGGFINGK